MRGYVRSFANATIIFLHGFPEMIIYRATAHKADLVCCLSEVEKSHLLAS